MRSMDEELILVDLDDHSIGRATKAVAHEQGLLHRAFSVFIIHDDYMLLQKRADQKYHSGGLWTNACCSHPRIGETLEEAAHRRLKEELGFDTELSEIFHFIYRHQFHESLYEYEYDHVFAGYYDGPVDFDQEEASVCEWMSFDQVKNALLNLPNQFTPWFITAAPRVMELMTQAENQENIIVEK